MGYAVSTGSSVGLLLDMLLLPSVMETLQLWIHRTGPFHMFQQFIDGADIGVGQLRALSLDLGGS